MSSEIFDQVTFKPSCSATEATLDIASIHIILPKQRTTKVLIRLRGCVGWSAPLLFAYGLRHIFAWPGPYDGWFYSPFNSVSIISSFSLKRKQEKSGLSRDVFSITFFYIASPNQWLSPSLVYQHLTRSTTEPTKRSLLPMKTQISLHIHTIQSVFTDHVKNVWVLSYQ